MLISMILFPAYSLKGGMQLQILLLIWSRSGKNGPYPSPQKKINKPTTYFKLPQLFKQTLKAAKSFDSRVKSTIFVKHQPEKYVLEPTKHQ